MRTRRVFAEPVTIYKCRSGENGQVEQTNSIYCLPSKFFPRSAHGKLPSTTVHYTKHIYTHTLLGT